MEYNAAIKVIIYSVWSQFYIIKNFWEEKDYKTTNIKIYVEVLPKT